MHILNDTTYIPSKILLARQKRMFELQVINDNIV